MYHDNHEILYHDIHIIYHDYQAITIYIYIYIKYFVWEDQREKECYIFHKVARWKIKHSLEYIALL